MEHYYQPEIETAPQEQLKALQDERLVKQVNMYGTMYPITATKWRIKA